jgi:hypothetical protein
MNTRHLYLGIDPGLGGAIGAVDADGSFHAVHDMPTTITTTGRRQIDPAAIAAIVRELDPAFVLVERVHARPGEGAVGGFAFGFGFGCILAVLAALNVPHDLVQPAVWKRRAGIPPGRDKAASIASAKRLLPDAAAHLSRVKDDGRAESLLLALQAWQSRTTSH